MVACLGGDSDADNCFQLNEERFAIGKGPVGFVNPVLYAYPQVLNDITNGTNAGCGTYGFSAIQG